MNLEISVTCQIYADGSRIRFLHLSGSSIKITAKQMAEIVRAAKLTKSTDFKQLGTLKQLESFK